MEFDNLIQKRRSIRKYKKESVSVEQIKKIVSTAQKAPSWKNSQVSRFYCAISDEARKRVLDCLPSFNQNNSENCGAYIISTIVDKISGFDSSGNYLTTNKDGYQFFDNGLQIENLCLEATNLGLGSLIMGLFDEEKIRNLFGISNNEKIVCVLAIGYPDINPTMPTKKPLEEILKII